MEKHLHVGDKVTVKTGAATRPKFWGKNGVIVRLIEDTVKELIYYDVCIGKNKIPQCLTKKELKVRG